MVHACNVHPSAIHDGHKTYSRIILTFSENPRDLFVPATEQFSRTGIIITARSIYHEHGFEWPFSSFINVLCANDQHKFFIWKLAALTTSAAVNRIEVREGISVTETDSGCRVFLI